MEIEGHLYVVFGVVLLMGGEVEGGGRMFAKEGGWGGEIERYVDRKKEVRYGDCWVQRSMRERALFFANSASLSIG